MRVSLMVALVVLGGLLGAEEKLFELADGRTVRGATVSEGGSDVIVQVQAGGASARVRLAKSEIKSVRPAPGAAEDAPVTVARSAAAQAPPAAGALEIKPRGAAASAGDFERLRRLLREAWRELAEDAQPAAPIARSPMPQDLDPTYWLLYGPLAAGVYWENYRGLVYREGVLPRARPFRLPWWTPP